MTKEELQYDLLKAELELTQSQMDKYDELSVKIKTWSVTVWIAATGWALETSKKEIILLSLLVIIFFWILDIINKTYRQDYKERRNQVADHLGALIKGNTIGPAKIPNLPVHKFNHFIREFMAPHVALPFLVLIIVSLVIYTRF